MQHIFNIKSPIRKSDSGAERKKKEKEKGKRRGMKKITRTHIEAGFVREISACGKTRESSFGRSFIRSFIHSHFHERSSL